MPEPMPITEDLKHRVFLAAPNNVTLPMGVSALGDHVSSRKKRAKLLAEQPDAVFELFVDVYVPVMTSDELKAVTDALNVGKGIQRREKLVELLQHVLSAGAEADQEPLEGIPKALCAESERLAAPTLHLQALEAPTRSQPRSAIWYVKRPEVDGQELWITVDLRRHPDDSVRADGILHVYSAWGQEYGTAVFEKRQLPRPGSDQISLHAVEEWDFPSVDVLMKKSRGSVKKWRDEIGWEPGCGHDSALNDYEAEWMETHPSAHFHGGDVYAQLGGWPISWPEQNAVDQLRRKLVVRTYEGSEPWLEVFKKGKSYEVICRIS